MEQDYLPIRAAARLYGVSQRTLRYYEEIGLITCRRRSDSRYREYSPQALERLELILLLRRLGLSLEEIGDVLEGRALPPLLAEKIRQSDGALLAAREQNLLLRRLQGLLVTRGPDGLTADRLLEELVFLNQQTERMLPMKQVHEEQYRIALGQQLVYPVAAEAEGDLVARVRALREQHPGLPPIRIYDTADLPDWQALVIWDGKPVLRRDYQAHEAVACREDILAVLEACIAGE